MFDSHCHLTSNRFDADRASVIHGMSAAGITACLTIGTGIADARVALALARAHPGIVHAAAGLDPFSCHETGDGFDASLAELRSLLAAGGFVALGECGIEHHHVLDPLPLQRERFSAQIALAAELDLPLVVHARSGRNGGDAHAVAVALVRAHPGVRGVIHSFDGDAAQARAWLDCGFHIAVNGMLTFKGNDALRAAMRCVPADRLLIETDAPYLAPVPHRGRRCEPAHAAVVAGCLADLRGERSDDVMAWAGRNARSLLRLG
ncbi:MAG: TatD family hydrolase [Planctomycetes bacterium]|nr:TatD family hydrolase [Planctomycetota bacterium]